MTSENASALSNILGWISLACWIVVYSPQIYENVLLQSGEGLSVLFVVIWLVGDLCNLLGAVLGNLLFTVIILAVYYSLCDITLLSQIYYYRWKSQQGTESLSDLTETVDETTPLLPSDNEVQRDSTISTRWIIIRYLLSLFFVFGVGTAAWAISEHMNLDAGTSSPPTGRRAWIVQTLGWTSALLYLGARLPQIFKNIKTRCEGLSPALFFFAIFGNATYAGSICAKSIDPKYLLTNASWLAGSVLTIFLDVLVLMQFVYYRSADRKRESTRQA